MIVPEGAEGSGDEGFLVEEDKVVHVYAYKKVANKVRPVATTLPEEFRIVRRAPKDPLKNLPVLPRRPPEFSPRGRYTEERRKALDVGKGGFLWPEEVKLVDYLIGMHERAFAWDESEKGRFSDEYFDPVMIPTVEHVPWVLKNIPIPPGIFDQVVRIIKEKVASGVYKPSNSSYRSRWFCVVKKDGKSLRLVHDLQPLNGVAIKDATVPPLVDHLAESFGGRGCYGLLDLYVAFDQRTLDPRSRDITSFQTPLGAYRLTSIPMGYTNSAQIMHGDVTFILQDEIPDVTLPFIDDVAIKGGKTRYELEGGGYETIKENPGIRRFVWEHLENVNRVLERVEVVGGTFSGTKLYACVPEAVVVGHLCTYEGRRPEASRVQRIKDWPRCETVSNVRGFLGTCGLVRIYVKDFGKMARPLNNLLRKGADFVWEEAEEEAMRKLKDAVMHCPALVPIDYGSGREVILAVDSSWIGVGYVILQIGEDGRRRPNRFGSITWNERESRYSQAKLELFGLFRALRACRIYIIGVKKLVVEVDAKYIKGMLNNPDIQPNATINRWIAGILLFDFTLVHVPGERHAGADGLSRRGAAEEDPEEEDDFEDWIDESYAFTVEALNRPGGRREEGTTLVLAMGGVEPVEIPEVPNGRGREEKVRMVQEFLNDPRRPDGMDDRTFTSFVRYASKFFVKGGRLWKKDKDGKHKVVVEPGKRLGLLREAHDSLGHKGIFTVRARLLERFWWVSLDQDVKWYVGSCHECQLRRAQKLHIPPTVPTPGGLFSKVHMDSMHMPTAYGYTHIVQARCSLSSYPEWRMLRKETGVTIGNFIYEEILCRWGAVSEIVTDNGTPFVAALEHLRVRFNINHIRISAYNSQANGIVERRHRDVREAAVKLCGGNEKGWPKVMHAVFWAERVTIQKSTGQSPYFLAHGIEPVFPFDLAEATYLVPPEGAEISDAELLAIRGRQLMKRKDDLREVRRQVHAARCASVKDFERRFARTIKDFTFHPGDLVLVRNSQIESEHSRKSKPRYFGPMVIVRRTKGGAYILAELTGAVSKLRYAAFRVVPYKARAEVNLDVRKIIREAEEAQEGRLEEWEEGGEGGGSDNEGGEGTGEEEPSDEEDSSDEGLN